MKPYSYCLIHALITIKSPELTYGVSCSCRYIRWLLFLAKYFCKKNFCRRWDKVTVEWIIWPWGQKSPWYSWRSRVLPLYTSSAWRTKIFATFAVITLSNVGWTRLWYFPFIRSRQKSHRIPERGEGSRVVLVQMNNAQRLHTLHNTHAQQCT